MTPFGFDSFEVVPDGGVKVVQGFDSPSALQTRAVGDDRAMGEVRFTTVPSTVHVTLRVRSDTRTANDATSGGMIASHGADGNPFADFQDGEWMPIDVVAKFETASRMITVRLGDKSASSTVPAACEAPVRLLVGSWVQGGNAGDFTLSIDSIAIDWN